MKKLLLLSLLALVPLVGFAEDGYVGEFEIAAPDPFSPFSVTADYIYVSPADFRTKNRPGDLLYIQRDVSFSYTQPCNPYWGLIFGAGYVGTTVDWKENPAFHETEFGYVNILVGAFTKAIPEWTWSLTFAPFFDTEAFDLAEYTLYQGVLLGKYEFCDGVIFDVGAILEVGLNYDKMWPILGFEFTRYDRWKLNLVYPLNISLQYLFTDKVTLAASVRFLRNRHRVKETDPIPKGIFEYHTTGGELDLIYQPTRWLRVIGFVGRTAGGDLKVTDMHNHHGEHFKFEGSFYGGATAILVF